jgi:hypothetical protein
MSLYFSPVTTRAEPNRANSTIRGMGVRGIGKARAYCGKAEKESTEVKSCFNREYMSRSTAAQKGTAQVYQVLREGGIFGDAGGGRLREWAAWCRALNTSACSNSIDSGERLWQMTTTWLYGFSSLILRARRSMATSMVDCNSRL